MIWVFGANGAIGQAMLKQAALQGEQTVAFSRRDCIQPLGEQIVVEDYFNETRLQAAIAQALALGLPDKIFIATGLLHNGDFQPEKTFKALNETQMMESFRVNTVLPSLIVQQCVKALPRRHALNIGVLSARVGSVSDNRMGGWHSYRASKAALNMLVKNFAIEFANKYPAIQIVALQPGTTDSALSKPFQKHLPAGQLQTPEFSAQCLWQILNQDLTAFNGELIDFEGNVIAP